MADWIADGDSAESFAAKLITLQDAFRITSTDEVVTAASVTEIPITDIASGILKSGDVLTLEDNTTYQTYSLTLTADYVTGDNHLHVASVAILTDLPVNSAIYFPLKTILSIIRAV